MFIIFLYCAGLPNGGTQEDGFLPSDRRTGRRARRHRSSTRSQDGKSQALSSEKENIEVRPNDSLPAGSGKLCALIKFYALELCYLTHSICCLDGTVAFIFSLTSWLYGMTKVLLEF